MKTWLLPLLSVAVLMLTLAGCSSYEPNISTAAKVVEVRTQMQIAEDIIKASTELEHRFRKVTTADTAKEEVPKVKELFERLAALDAELITAGKRVTDDEAQLFDRQYKARLDQARESWEKVYAAALKNPGIGADFTDAYKDGVQKIQKEEADAKAKPAPPPPENKPASPPDSSGWGVWILCLLILGICSGFLSRDGIWSNAIRLVNVVFAGLLAMNFYEPLAKWITNYGAELHTYVALFDFLAFWTCFVIFMLVFRAATDAVSKIRMRFLKVIDLWGGVVLSLCTGWIMVGLILTSLHAAPLSQYPLMGSFQPQNSMFFGMLAPDREWLGFTKYQSSGPFCRTVEGGSFPPDYIEKHLVRRMHVEKYINGNNDHAIRVNPQLMTKH